MEWLAALLPVAILFVGLPVAIVVVLRAVGYDWDKPWLMWRTRAGPLPPWVYLSACGLLALGLLIAVLTR